LYTVLDAKQLDEIHLATLNVLERAGVMVHEHNVLQLLKSAGCEVDQERKVAKFPEKVIDDTIKKAPHSLVLGGRDKEHDLLIERGKTFTRPGSAYTKVLDIDTGQCRNGTLKDAEIAAKLVDVLENISFCATHVSPSDVPQAVADIYAVKVCLEATRKHLFFSPLTHETFRTIIEAAQVVRGDVGEFQKRPLVSFLAATSTPLKIAQDCARQLLDCAKFRVPVMLDSSPMLGATGPVTLAGSLVLQNAEDLAMNAIIQLSNPGSPVIYGARCAPIDMRTGFLSWGAAETALMSAAAVQIAHYYDVPVDGHGPCTDSKTFDEQAGFEKSMTGLLPAMAGAEIISAAGIVDSLVVTSPLQLIIDDEFFGIMFRVLREIRVDHETLAAELIAQVGYDASYLKSSHTLKNYEKEHHLAKLFDKRFRGPWETAGAESIERVARKRFQTILSKHEITPLDRDIQKKLNEIVHREEKRTTT
jgi:trimethylamine--corrinoid protein Co-methyltransferase